MIKNNRGSATIFVFVSCLVIFIMLAMVVDIARLYAVKVSVRHGLNLALRAAADQLDPDKLADADNPQLVILPFEAEIAFYDVLQRNLRLDSANNPLAGSIADHIVEVCYFRVVNGTPSGQGSIYEELLPHEYTYGGYTERIEKVSVSAIIKVPVKLSGLARVAVEMPTYTDLYVHSTVGPQVLPKDAI